MVLRILSLGAGVRRMTGGTMSIDDAREALANEVAWIEGEKFDWKLALAAIEALARAVAREEIARLSSLPRGEDVDSGPYPRAPISSLTPTPPAKDTEGGETTAEQRAHIAFEQSEGSAYHDGDSDEIKAVLRDYERQARRIADLEQRLAEVQNSADAAASLRDDWRNKCRAAEARARESDGLVETLKRRVERLERAVRPFARIVDKGGEPIALKWGANTYTHVLTSEHFREASRALTDTIDPDATT